MIGDRDGFLDLLKFWSSSVVGHLILTDFSRSKKPLLSLIMTYPKPGIVKVWTKIIVLSVYQLQTLLPGPI